MTYEKLKEQFEDTKIAVGQVLIEHLLDVAPEYDWQDARWMDLVVDDVMAAITKGGFCLVED